MQRTRLLIPAQVSGHFRLLASKRLRAQAYAVGYSIYST
jgi:hypothetical protein